MVKDNILELQGEVIESSNGKFKVKVSDKLIVVCSLSGKIRLNNVKVLVGDTVKIEVSAYDLTKGRVMYRCKIGT